MIDSINTSRSYLYETSEKTSAAASGIANSLLSELAKKKLQEEDTTSSETSSIAELSASEHMQMMRSFMTIPEQTDSEDSTRITSATGNESLAQAGDISEIDADGDGTISADEYEEMMKQMGISDALSAEEFFAQFDTNEDGEISVEEMPEPGTVMGTQNERRMPPPIPPEEISELEATEEVTTTSASTDTTTESASVDLNSLLLQALRAYENNYESMFETTEGSVLSSKA